MSSIVDMIQKLELLLGHENALSNQPMSKHTTFKIGGNADIIAVPDSEELLVKTVSICKSENIPYMIMGNGSNVLVSDKGIEGVVILTEKLCDITKDGDLVVASAGALLSKTANFAAKNSLTGLEFASGIPGSIGGGVFMNAGAYGGELKDVVMSVKIITNSGEIKEISKSECDFGYRCSIFQKNQYIILSVKFKLNTGNYEDIVNLSNEYNKKRKDKQPLEYPSAGSTFKRPDGYFAGKLIEDAGLKGYKIGGAMVSEKHSGFVINAGGASANDVMNLVSFIKKSVYDKFNVKLDEEIKIIGKV